MQVAPVAAPVQAVVVSPEIADKSETRRDWAMIALFGGAVVMTAFAAFCLYLVQDNARYVFWIAIAAQIQLLLILSAFAGLLVKRSLKISKSEISIVDDGLSLRPAMESPQDTDMVRRGDVEQEVQEAVAEVPAVDVPTESKDGSTDKPS